jgi:hypothetical protein
MGDKKPAKKGSSKKNTKGAKGGSTAAPAPASAPEPTGQKLKK